MEDTERRTDSMTLDEQMIARLRMSDRTTAGMIEDMGSDRWTAVCAIAQALHAMRYDDPKTELKAMLERVGNIVREYGGRMPEWCSLEVLTNFEGLKPEGAEWEGSLESSRDYLEAVDGIFAEMYGDVTPGVRGEEGNYLAVTLATACMSYDSAKRALKAAERIAKRALRELSRRRNDAGRMSQGASVQHPLAPPVQVHLFLISAIICSISQAFSPGIGTPGIP